MKINDNISDQYKFWLDFISGKKIEELDERVNMADQKEGFSASLSSTVSTLCFLSAL